MLSIITHKFPFFKKIEIWFYNGEIVKEGSYTSYCYVQRDLDLPFENELKEFTSTIDLTKEETILFNSINTTFRYHIKKARTINFDYNFNSKPSIEDCKKLITSFKKFAREKKISSMNKKRILALQRSNNIFITEIKQLNVLIATHVYLFDTERIILLHTYHNSTYQNTNIGGYANKFMHWKNILLFKKMNFKIYDFGGIDPEKLQGISNFKLSFGGKIEKVNSYTRIASPFRLIFKLHKSIR